MLSCQKRLKSVTFSNHMIFSDFFRLKKYSFRRFFCCWQELYPSLEILTTHIQQTPNFTHFQEILSPVLLRKKNVVPKKTYFALWKVVCINLSFFLSMSLGWHSTRRSRLQHPPNRSMPTQLGKIKMLGSKLSFKFIVINTALHRAGSK